MEITKDVVLRSWQDEENRDTLPEDVRNAPSAKPRGTNVWVRVREFPTRETASRSTALRCSARALGCSSSVSSSSRSARDRHLPDGSRRAAAVVLRQARLREADLAWLAAVAAVASYASVWEALVRGGQLHRMAARPTRLNRASEIATQATMKKTVPTLPRSLPMAATASIA